MGRTYNVPRNVKGESRILFIFTMRSFIYTIVAGVVGILLFFLFSLVGLDVVGWICIALFALIGYGLGSLVIPDSPIVGNLRKAGGEQVGEILMRTATFSRRKKIYVYKKGGE